MRKTLLPLLVAAVLLLSACETAAPEGGAPAAEPTADTSAAESIKGTAVGVTYKDAGFTLTLPDGWTYEEWNRFPEQASFGVDLRPENGSGALRVSWSDSFGVCGTGLRTDTLTLNDGSKASVGYYDGKADWDYVYFQDAPQAYSAVNDGLSGKTLDTALKILQTAVFLPVSLTSDTQTGWTKRAEYSYGFSGIQLSMPDDWDYSVTPYQPDGFGYSISLHAPHGGEVVIRSDRYYDEWQASAEDYITLADGWGPATVYYHDDPNRPYAVFFNNAPGVYYARLLNLSDQTQVATALEILRQIRFTKGETSRKTAEALVGDFTDVSGELKCSYDISSGVWTVQELSKEDGTLLREFFVSQDCAVTQRGS